MRLTSQASGGPPPVLARQVGAPTAAARSIHFLMVVDRGRALGRVRVGQVLRTIHLDVDDPRFHGLRRRLDLPAVVDRQVGELRAPDLDVVQAERLGNELRRGEQRELLTRRQRRRPLFAGLGEAFAEAHRGDADPPQHRRGNRLRGGRLAREAREGGGGGPERHDRGGLGSKADERSAVHETLRGYFR